jgi:hypothetical protein
MDEKKITILLIGVTVVLFVIGFFVWLLIRPPSASAPPTTQGVPSSNQNSGGGNSQTTIVTPPSQTSALPDPQQEYRKLLANFAAQEVQFSRVDSSTTGELSSVYGMYEADIATYKSLFPGQTDLSIGISSTDLNGDGVAEAIVRLDLPGYCGTAGCTLDVLQKDGVTWKNVLSVLAQGAVGVGNIKINGYSNLYLTLYAQGYQSNVMEFAWIGQKYQPYGIVAQWNGSAFQIIQ